MWILIVIIVGYFLNISFNKMHTCMYCSCRFSMNMLLEKCTDLHWIMNWLLISWGTDWSTRSGCWLVDAQIGQDGLSEESWLTALLCKADPGTLSDSGDPSFEQTWNPVTQECFVQSLVEIGTVVLEKKMKM